MLTTCFFLGGLIKLSSKVIFGMIFEQILCSLLFLISFISCPAFISTIYITSILDSFLAPSFVTNHGRLSGMKIPVQMDERITSHLAWVKASPLLARWAWIQSFQTTSPFGWVRFERWFPNLWKQLFRVPDVKKPHQETGGLLDRTSWTPFGQSTSSERQMGIMWSNSVNNLDTLGCWERIRMYWTWTSLLL